MLNLVIYVDGSSRPSSRGTGGWGVYGYGYNPETITPTKMQGTLQLPTQQGFLDLVDIPKKGDGLFIIKPEFYIVGYGGELESTSSRGELLALIRTLEYVYTHRDELKSVWVYGDSAYARLAYLKINDIHANGYKDKRGDPLKNLDLIRLVYHWVSALGPNTPIMAYEYIEAHAGHAGNEGADVLALRGVQCAYRGLNDVAIHRTENPFVTPKVKPNRLLWSPRWYFKTNHPVHETLDGRFGYYIGNHGKIEERNDVFGKAESEQTFSVVWVKEQDPVLRLLQDHQKAVLPNDEPVYGYLSYILSTKVYPELVKSGTSYIHTVHDQTKNHNYSLQYYTHDPLTYVANPRLRANYGFKQLEHLERILANVVCPDKVPPHFYVKVKTTSIVDSLYEQVSSKSGTKRKLKAQFTSALKSFKVVVYFDELLKGLTLTLGQDLPDRNTLSAITDDVSDVQVVTYLESGRGYRFAVVIFAGDDVIITSSVYSNLWLLDV